MRNAMGQSSFVTKKRWTKKKRRKMLLIIIAAAVVLFIGSAYINKMLEQHHLAQAKDNLGKIHDISGEEETEILNASICILDSGDGECVFVDSGKQKVLLDTGDEASRKKIMKSLDEKTEGTLDYLIITSCDENRMGNAAAIIEKMKVKNVIYPDLPDGSAEKKLLEGIFETAGLKNITSQRLKSQSVDLGNDSAVELNKIDDGKRSYYLPRINIKGHSLLMLGAISDEQIEKQFGNILPSDYILLANNGRRTGNDVSFIQSLDPDYVFVSSKAPDKGGAADLVLLEEIKEDANVVSTYDSGRIEMIFSASDKDPEILYPDLPEEETEN